MVTNMPNAQCPFCLQGRKKFDTINSARWACDECGLKGDDDFDLEMLDDEGRSFSPSYEEEVFGRGHTSTASVSSNSGSSGQGYPLPTPAPASESSNSGSFSFGPRRRQPIISRYGRTATATGEEDTSESLYAEGTCSPRWENLSDDDGPDADGPAQRKKVKKARKKSATKNNYQDASSKMGKLMDGLRDIKEGKVRESKASSNMKKLMDGLRDIKEGRVRESKASSNMKKLMDEYTAIKEATVREREPEREPEPEQPEPNFAMYAGQVVHKETIIPDLSSIGEERIKYVYSMQNKKIVPESLKGTFAMKGSLIEFVTNNSGRIITSSPRIKSGVVDYDKGCIYVQWRTKITPHHCIVVSYEFIDHSKPIRKQAVSGQHMHLWSFTDKNAQPLFSFVTNQRDERKAASIGLWKLPQQLHASIKQVVYGGEVFVETPEPS